MYPKLNEKWRSYLGQGPECWLCKKIVDLDDMRLVPLGPYFVDESQCSPFCLECLADYLAWKQEQLDSCPTGKIIRDKLASGQTVLLNFEGPPRLTYTVGLRQLHNHPDVCMLGLRPALAEQCLGHVMNLLRQGRVLQTGERLSLQTSTGALTLAVVQVQDLSVGCFIWNKNLFQTQEGLQLVWADADARFVASRRQPILGPLQ